MFFRIFSGICILISLCWGILSCISKNWEYGLTLIISAVLIFSLIKSLNSLTEKVEKLEKQVSELKNPDKKDS